MKSKRIEKYADHVTCLMRKAGVSSITFDSPVPIDSWELNPSTGKEANIRIRTIYSSLNADTNVGSLNLLDSTWCIDDWYSILEAVQGKLP